VNYGSSIESCVLYARLSVSVEESVSIERQLESCRKYAEARGWKVVGQYVDDGVSATANRPEDRKGWSELLLAGGTFDAVVIWKVDRLARRVLDFLHADEALRQRSAGLVAVEDPIDMTSPQGRAFAVMLAVFGEMEAEAIRARVRAARVHLAKTGRWTGGGVPYGYTVIDNPEGPGRVLVKDPDRIGWVERIARMALDGATVNEIAMRLTAEKAPLPGRVRPTGRQGWNRQTVDGLLRNPTLAGMTPRNPGAGRSVGRRDPFAVACDENGQPLVRADLAVITTDEFADLQRLLAAKDTPQARPFHERRRTSPFLARVAHCDDCGACMCRGTNGGKPVLYCPECRQTISRSHLDPYLAKRLLAERGDVAVGDLDGREAWARCGTDETARRSVLVSQVESLRIRRGVVGRYFDEDRVLLSWRALEAEAS